MHFQHFHVPLQHFSGTSRFLMAFQGNTEVLAALTQISLIPWSSIHSWVWVQDHLSSGVQKYPPEGEEGQDMWEGDTE